MGGAGSNQKDETETPLKKKKKKKFHGNLHLNKISKYNKITNGFFKKLANYQLKATYIKDTSRPKQTEWQIILA